MPDFIDRITEAEQRAHELEGQLSDPEVAKQPGQFQKLAKQLAKLRPMVETGSEYRAVLGQLEESEALLEDDDADVAELARSEIDELKQERGRLEERVALVAERVQADGVEQRRRDVEQ